MKTGWTKLRPHYLPDVVIGTVCVFTLATYWFWCARIPDRSRRVWVRSLLLLGTLAVMIGVAMSPNRIGARFPNVFAQWARCAAIFVCFWVLYSIPFAGLIGWTGRYRPDRHRMLKAAAGAALSAPPLVAAAAFLKREELTFREVDVFLPSLPKSLQGLRLVQLSDIHLSPFVSEALLARAVAMANETKADLALVTGDLVSRLGDPLDLCLRHLSRLRSAAGTYGCMGNHEIYANALEYTAIEGAKLGMSFLRSSSKQLQFGDAVLNLVGVDYQRRGNPYLVNAEKLVIPGATNVLLSHNPDVFPVAAAKGYDLTLAGHTHGGQVNFEILEHSVNIARFYTPYIYGRYELQGSSIFVTRGIGTVGAPARLGAPPEVALIRLCAS